MGLKDIAENNLAKHVRNAEEVKAAEEIPESRTAHSAAVTVVELTVLAGTVETQSKGAQQGRKSESSERAVGGKWEEQGTNHFMIFLLHIIFMIFPRNQQWRESQR